MGANASLLPTPALDVAVVAALVLAFLARPPQRRWPDRVISLLGAAGLTVFAMGIVDALVGLGSWEEQLGPSVIAMCVARWLARAPSDGDDDGGSERDDDDHRPPPDADWEAFDRAREEWRRHSPPPRPRVPS